MTAKKKKDIKAVLNNRTVVQIFVCTCEGMLCTVHVYMCTCDQCTDSICVMVCRVRGVSQVSPDSQESRGSPDPRGRLDPEEKRWVDDGG